jgi:pimeloyl-ACP methyl ester carboxylesterase
LTSGPGYAAGVGGGIGEIGLGAIRIFNIAVDAASPLRAAARPGRRRRRQPEEFMFDSDARAPEAIVADLEQQAERFETPCGDGVLVWRAWGEGPPLVLLHGAQGSWAHWIRNIPALSARRRLLAPDLPGYGDSASLQDVRSGFPLAEVIAKGLRQLGVAAPLDVAGFSLGGLVGAHLAACAPELVRRIVIIGSGGLETPVGHMDLKRLSGLDDEARLAAQRHNLLQMMLHDPAAADGLALYLQATKTRRGTLDAKAIVLPDGLVRVLPQVRAQVDLIWGECDRPHFNPEAQAAVVRRTHPDATLQVAPGAGHWVMYEAAERFNAMLTGLLDQPLRRRES